MKDYFEPSFQVFKKNELVQLKKKEQVYFGEKEGEAMIAVEKTVIYDA